MSSFITCSFYFIGIRDRAQHENLEGKGEPGFIVWLAIFERILFGDSGKRITFDKLVVEECGTTEAALR